jgi:hypothetical protein
MTQTTAMTAYDCNVSDVWSLQLWDGREKPNDWANDWRNVTPNEALHLKMASLAKLDRYPNCRDDSHLFLSEYEKESPSCCHVQRLPSLAGVWGSSRRTQREVGSVGRQRSDT